MRINYVWIEDYKNLKNFDIFFNEKNSLNMIIGENGSGKTNFLMSLLRIYKDLYTLKDGYKKNRVVKHRFSAINYKLSYFDEDNNMIGISKDNKNLNFFKISKDNKKELDSKDFTNDLFNKNFNIEFAEIINTFPRNIMAYYSGTSSAMRSVLNQFNNSLKLQNENNNLPMTSIGNEALPFLFLCNYIEINTKESHNSNFNFKTFYRNRFNIVGISQFSISFKEDINQIEYFESKFKLLYILKKIVSGEKMKSGGISYKFNKMDIKKLYQVITKEKISSLDLFEMILTLKKEIRGFKMQIYFEKENQSQAISYTEFSEGEKQFVLILSLLNLYKNENSLFLLDEPDTFLHPRWQRELTDEVNSMKNKSNIIFTTHSPLTLGNVRKESINLFKNGTSDSPDYESKYSETSEILEVIMGVTSRHESIEKEISNFYKEFSFGNLKKANTILEILTSKLKTDDIFILEANMLMEGCIIDEENN